MTDCGLFTYSGENVGISGSKWIHNNSKGDVGLFRGITELNLDAKGRMAMPTRYRERLREHSSGALVITIDIKEKCLAIYPQPEWEAIQVKLDALSSFNEATVTVKRLLMGNAIDVDMDANGRVLIPQALRKYAGLEKQVKMIGQGKKFELWDAERWDERSAEWLAKTAATGDAVPAELESLSL